MSGPLNALQTFASLSPTQMESVVVAIVGGGQAGLATSRELTKAGLEHVVLERGRVGETWRSRWDSFRLVTPNWTVRLPDGHYAGLEPDGFMPRDESLPILNATPPNHRCRSASTLLSSRWSRYRVMGSCFAPRLATFTRKRWSSRPVLISVRTGQRRLRRCRQS